MERRLNQKFAVALDGVYLCTLGFHTAHPTNYQSVATLVTLAVFLLLAALFGILAAVLLAAGWHQGPSG